MIGTRIGRYSVLAPLGQGGMATVWSARDELLGRTVALKVLGESLAGDPEARRRFLHEARASALLEHPGIAMVFDAGEQGSTVYITMALVDGETLSQRVGRSLLPIPEVVRIIREAAAALRHAHARGVVHRDVTGRNIMLSRDGRVIVLDFGLALAAGNSRITTTGTTIGTVAYMAPEIVLGKPADPRSDLYGLGVVLYETLTGGLPFVGDRPEALLYAACHQSPRSPRLLRPEISPALERVIFKSIARDPEARYQNADEMSADLAAVGRLEADLAGETAARAAAKPASADDSSETLRADDPSAPLRPGRGTPVYLVVLPFEDLSPGSSPGSEGQLLAQGLAETVSVSLARLPGMHIIPSPGVPDGSVSEDPRAIARRLGASLLLRGTVQRSGMELRVGFSLVDPHRGQQVTGDSVDGSALELFDLEDRVVARIRSALGFSEGPIPVTPRPRPRDPAARERYLQALGYLQRYDNEASVDGAIALLERLVASEGESASLLAAMGRAYLHKHTLTGQASWHEKAASSCERALALDPDSPDVAMTLGDLHASVGRHSEAADDFRRALSIRPDLFEALLGLTRACLDAGHFEEAEETCRRAIRARDRDWRGYSNLGYVFWRQGAFVRAVEPFRRVVQLTPDNARGYRNLGSVYFEMDRFEDAREAYRRSLEIQQDGLAYSYMGTVLYYLGSFEEAVVAFEKATQMAPSIAQVWANLSSACRRVPGRKGQADEAADRSIALMRQRLDRNPGEAQLWARLAGLLADRGRREESIRAVGRALELAPREVKCLADAGRAYFILGERAKALEWFREAVRHGYGTRKLTSSPELAPLREDPEFLKILEVVPASEPPQPRAKPKKGGRR